MNQGNCNTKAKKFQHFSLDERKIIKNLIKMGESVTSIAKILGRNKSSVSREIKRGTIKNRKYNKTNKKYEPLYIDVFVYDPYYANEKYLVNRENSKHLPSIFKYSAFIELLDNLILKQKYSPDVALHILRKLFPDEKFVCVKTIYNWIENNYLKTKNIDLLLKVKRKNRKPKKKSKYHRGTSIEERPKEINKREEFGHFEGDSVIPKGRKGQIITITERKTRFAFTFKYKKKSAKNIVNAIGKIKKMFGNKFNLIMKSITFDNGTEFTSWKKIEKKYKVKVYFAHPYSSSERGSNENFNGILRRYIPKKMKLEEISDTILEKATIHINSTMRRILNYKSSSECFKTELKNLTT